MPYGMTRLDADECITDWYFDTEDDGTVTFTINDQVTLSGTPDDVATLLEQMLEEVK